LLDGGDLKRVDGELVADGIALPTEVAGEAGGAGEFGFDPA
jgi:hypothetical protein